MLKLPTTKSALLMIGFSIDSIYQSRKVRYQNFGCEGSNFGREGSNFGCGFKFLCFALSVEADTGTIGGSLSHEYHVISQIGEDTIYTCER